MKFYIFSLISALLLNTCNSEDVSDNSEVSKTVQNFELDKFPQKWELFQMTGQMSDEPPSTGDDMSWQEFYLLKEDNTFLKQRIQDDKITESQGTYSFSNANNENSLILKHNSTSSIIGNCTGDNTETLLFNKKEKNLTATWWACDGPGLFYKRTE